MPQYDAILPSEALFRHILIVGSTGSGKTRTASIIIKSILEKKRLFLVVYDWHSECGELLPGSHVLNPFKTPLQLFKGERDDISVITSVFELTPPQEYILDKITKRISFSNLK